MSGEFLGSAEARVEQRKRRGLTLWDYRMIDDPVPESPRYRVLKVSGGRCAPCGATAKEQPLDADHIKPLSRGSPTVLENLQVLCAKGNRAKGNNDDTDSRLDPRDVETDPACPLCREESRAGPVETLGTVFAIRDKYPVAEGHVLVIPRRHTPDFFTMTERERTDANKLLRLLRNRIAGDDRSVTGFNVGMTSGESAGQTIPHAHIRLIPRMDGDTPKPRGGVRGVIPGKTSY